MDMVQAAKDTLKLAQLHGMELHAEDVSSKPELQYSHLKDMVEKIEEMSRTASDAKIGRWLGWLQACVVTACPWITLEDMKKINVDNSKSERLFPLSTAEVAVPIRILVRNLPGDAIHGSTLEGTSEKWVWTLGVLMDDNDEYVMTVGWDYSFNHHVNIDVPVDQVAGWKPSKF